MNGGRLFVFGLALLALSGCFTVHKGEHVTETTIGKDDVRYTADRISTVKLRTFRSVDGYRFSLEAVGDFVAHEGQWRTERDKGEKAISIGIWPGYPAFEGGKGTFVMCQLFAYWWNPFALGVSLWSCVATPFSDQYNEQPGIGAVAVFGCYKYLDRSRAGRGRSDFIEQSTKKSSLVRLRNYRVSFQGSEYYDEDGEFKLTGWALRPGMRVKVKITSAPSLNRDSKDTFEELVGMEIETELK